VKRSILLTAACLALCAQEEIPTFRSGTTLVEFTVVAVDGKGNPVTDLRKEEFAVTEQGKPREIAIFRFEGASAATGPEPLPPGVFTNRVEYTTGPPRNITAILLDGLNTLPQDQAAAREQVMRYLREIEPGTRVAVYALGAGLTVLHDFTDDAASLRARMEESLKRVPVHTSQDVLDLECFAATFRSLAAVSPCSVVELFLRQPDEGASAETTYYQTAADRRREATLAALEALGDHLAGIPGRKNLVWIGGGISIHSVTGAQRVGNVHHGFRSYEARIRRTAERLASQGVAVYPVDALAMQRGMGPPPRRTGRGSSPKLEMMANIVSNYQPESANDLLAAVTGGRVTRMTGDLTKGIELAASDRSASYTIGFYAGEPDGKWRKMDVKSKRRGVRLTFRQGYTAEAPAEQPVDWSEAQWRSAIANPAGSTAIHLDARLDSGDADLRALLLQIDGVSFRKAGDKIEADLDIVIAEKTAIGDAAYHIETVKIAAADAQTTALRYRYGWKIKPETAALRVLVRDRLTGRLGALDLPARSR
jgi:VWFA-related protein